MTASVSINAANCASKSVRRAYISTPTYCRECGELKFQHAGDRCKLDPIPCLCDTAVDGEPEPETKRARTAAPAAERGMNGLDASGQGMRETYERKLAVIESRYSNLEPKQIITRLLGVDVSVDEVGVTGEQGRGRILACFLLSIKDDGFDFLSRGVKPWLEQQLPKYANLYPAQKLCIEHAIQFYPKLERGLAAAAAARAPAPDFATPDRAAPHREPPQAPPPDF